jgi:nitrite reductase/ring-hydroxylating ferredoxin subunit
VSQLLASRRVVFHGLSAMGVAAVLAGCGGEAEPTSGSSPTTSSPSPTESSPSEPPPSTASPSRKETRAPQKPALATIDEIPVGGGIVLMDERIVIVQPTAGEFTAWSAICKHEGQIVGSVEDNVITCPFHGSQYDAATGAVVGGPAPSGLDPIRIRVADGRITRA